MGRRVIRLNTPSPPTPEATGWTNITPGDVVLNTGGDNVGASGHPVVDPTNPAVIYAGFDTQGVWKSVNYGRTWSKVSPSGSMINDGKIWCMAIAPDGSYLLGGGGNNFTNGRYLKCLRSNDGGVTWFEKSGSLSAQPYGYDINPSDANHVIMTSHTSGDGNVWESKDGGATWSVAFDSGWDSSGYAYFGLTGNTILYVGDGDGPSAGRTVRATWNGSAWSASGVDDQGHYHGSHQMYVDRVNGIIYNPGPSGVRRSSNDGASWTTVTTTVCSSAGGTATKVYAGAAYATNGSFPPHLQDATKPGNSGTWTERSDPSGMINGPRAMCHTINDAGQHVIITCNWCAGLWRFVE